MLESQQFPCARSLASIDISLNSLIQAAEVVFSPLLVGSYCRFTGDSNYM